MYNTAARHCTGCLLTQVYDWDVVAGTAESVMEKDNTRLQGIVPTGRIIRNKPYPSSKQFSDKKSERLENETVYLKDCRQG